MHIKIEEPFRPTTAFQLLLEGQTFLLDGTLFLKIDPCGICNAVRLTYPQSLTIHPDVQVIPVDCDVTVRYRK